MNGFFLIKGDCAKLDALVSTTEWITHITRAALHLEWFWNHPRSRFSCQIRLQLICDVACPRCPSILLLYRPYRSRSIVFACSIRRNLGLTFADHRQTLEDVSQEIERKRGVA